MIDMSTTYVLKMLEHEKALAELYEYFASQSRDLSSFWTQLSNEEVSHGELLRLLYERIRQGELRFRRKEFNLNDIIGSLNMVKGISQRVHISGYGDADALNVAAELESTMIEHMFFSVFEGDAEEVKSDFDALLRYTEVHLNKVLAKKEELNMQQNSNRKSGGAMTWLLFLSALGIGAYLAFGVMKIHRIRGKIDEAMGKKPVTAVKEDDGLLFAHQERLRQQSEDHQEAMNKAAEYQEKAGQRNREIQREIMRSEGQSSGYERE